MAAWTEFYAHHSPSRVYPAGSPHGYAAVAIKRELAYLDYSAAGFNPESLTLGDSADTLIRRFQHDQGLVVDGAVGPRTAKQLFVRRVLYAEKKYSIPNRYTCQQLQLESAWDPGATGAPDTPKPGYVDRALAQINSYWHADVTDAEAYDPAFAIDWEARVLHDLWRLLGDWELALAAYNVGVGPAKTWNAAGRPADSVAGRYIAAVLAQTC